MTLPKDQFASLDAVPAEVVLEKMSEFQAEADEQEAIREEHHDEAKAAKERKEKVLEKVSALARARRQGLTVRMLKGGELTTEEPEAEKPLPLFDGKTAATGEKEEAAAAEDDPPFLVHRTTGDKGEECIVRRHDDGKWWGRADGKPCAQGLVSSSLAKREVEKVVSGGRLLTWTAEPMTSGEEDADEAPESPPSV